MFRKEVSHYGKIVKMCQFYSDSSVFFCNQLYIFYSNNLVTLEVPLVDLPPDY
jgi:hypothetical protein